MAGPTHKESEFFTAFVILVRNISKIFLTLFNFESLDQPSQQWSINSLSCYHHYNGTMFSVFTTVQHSMQNSSVRTGTCTDRALVVLKHQPLLPWMREVPFLLEPTFFIHQYLRIKVTLSVINSPQMCFNIRRGIYLSSCENFAPTCSATPLPPSPPLPPPRSAPRATKRVHLLLLWPAAPDTQVMTVFVPWRCFVINQPIY